MFMLIFVCFVFCVVWLCLKRKKTLKKPPLYPGAWPILGNATIFGFGTGDTTYLWRMAQEASEIVTNNGGIMRLKIGFLDYYLLTDPEDILTASNACLEKPYFYRFSKCWLGNGLLSGNATIWKRHRKLLNPSFNLQILHTFMNIFNAEARMLVSDLESEVGKGYFHPFSYLERTALEAIYQTAIGMNTGEDAKLHKKDFANAEKKMMNIIAQRFQKLWLHSDFIYQFSDMKRKQDEAVKVINETYHAIMDSKKPRAIEEHDADGNKFKVFMDRLLDLSADGSLTSEEVWEEVNTIIVAGHDTSATTLLITLMLLGTHQAVQEKVLQELKEVFGDSSRDVQKDDLPKLVYVEAVIKESLRLYPLGVVKLRYSAEDVQLKKYTMPAGTICMMLLYGLHRHPLWGDADKFRPERFLEDDIAKTNAFAGFGLGKRNCIGRTYAMMFLKTSLCHLLRRYKISADISKVQFKIDVMLKPESGDMISIEERTV